MTLRKIVSETSRKTILDYRQNYGHLIVETENSGVKNRNQSIDLQPTWRPE